MRRRPSRSLTSGGRGGSASHQATRRAASPDARPPRSARRASARRRGSRARSRRSGRAARRRCPAAGRRRAPGRGARAPPRPATRPRGRGARCRARRGRALRTRARCGEPRDDGLAATGADADRDLVLDAGSVEQVSVQLAVGQAAGLDRLGEAQGRAAAGGMREQERVIRRVAHDRPERAGRLGLGRDRLVADRARRELDAVPRQHVCGDEPGKRLERATAQFGLRPGLRRAPERVLVRRPRLCRPARAWRRL